MADDPGLALLKAVSQWIEANGGKPVCLGGISIVKRGRLRRHFDVCVRVTGDPPKVKVSKGNSK